MYGRIYDNFFAAVRALGNEGIKCEFHLKNDSYGCSIYKEAFDGREYHSVSYPDFDNCGFEFEPLMREFGSEPQTLEKGGGD